MRLTSTKIVLTIMIPSVILAVVLVLGEALRSPFDQTVSLEPVDHTIMGHRFRVPKAYLILREDWFSRELGPRSGILMAGTLPNIEPYTEQTAHMWEGIEHLLEMVDFDLWGITFGNGLSEEYFQAEYLRKCIPGPLDFLVCEYPYGVAPVSQDVLIKAKGDKKIALLCSKPGAHRKEFCRGNFPLIDNVELKIRFGKKYLDRAEAIIAQVYELVCRFYQPGQRPVTYNYCETGVYHGKTGTN